MTFRSVFDAAFIIPEFDQAGINTQCIPSIWKYVLQNPTCEWRDIPSLPSAAYSLLSSKFKPCTSVVDSVFDSTDQVTTKLLIKLQVQLIDVFVVDGWPFQGSWSGSSSHSVSALQNALATQAHFGSSGDLYVYTVFQLHFNIITFISALLFLAFSLY
ncbi:hypothetical protein L2E82_10108 [Cichorium intybus]|uniref:Uncharacterized protein n=1 Tax=Cichorium intybus TaxID=13427 RepID=A0ACB9G9L3_CICIN|nr:hypothetical protein L2E82_10108 [Cichorium intybus]